MGHIVSVSSIPLHAHRALVVHLLHHQDQMQTARMPLVHDIVLSEVRTPPDSFLTILVCAAPPTRDTEIPALTAGRIPELNKSVSRKI